MHASRLPAGSVIILDQHTAALAEDRIATQDGYLWPVDRSDMVTTRAIRARMAEDLGRLLHDRGAAAVILTEDYLRLGWDREQVKLHGGPAAELYDRQRRENACGNDAALTRGAA